MRGDLTVTINYSEMALLLTSLKNNAKKTIEACDKITATLDKAGVEQNVRSDNTMDSTG